MMSKHFEILIDASGSMGYMEGTEYQDKLLLPDGSTRTDLVKKILINSIIPKLSFVDSLTISTFSAKFELNANGTPKLTNGNKQYIKKIEEKYSGIYDDIKTNNVIESINNPKAGATPLYTSLFLKINNSKINEVNIIVLSDGDDSFVEDFDKKLLDRFKKTTKNYTIYFIGIDQNVEAQKKSKNLAQQTNGFYVNINIMNYEEHVFDSLLFEWNASITSNALKDSLNINTSFTKTKPIIAVPNEKRETVREVQDIKNKEVATEVTKPEAELKDVEIKKQKIEKIESTDLIKQVEDNTKSLKLITSQLDSIVKEISFIRKGSSTDEDEFTVNEDEANNRAIGYECEKYLNSYFIKKQYDKIEWLNEVSERYGSFDFKIVHDGLPFLVECKGTSNDTKEFFLTQNEWLFYLQNRKNYRLYFVYDINTDKPKHILVLDLLKEMKKGKLIPCSSKNRKVKAKRILFQIID